MTKNFYWLNLLSVWVGIVLFIISSFIFYLKKKCWRRLLFFSGFGVVGIGSLIQLCVPVNTTTFDELGNILSSSGISWGWYTGSIIVNIGIILAAIGFSLIVFEK